MSRTNRASGWHSRCASIDVTMKHAAAFILLLTVAGTPVTTLACVGWCAPNALPAGVSCHHHGSGAGASVTDADSTCAGLLATIPFLTEDARLTRTAIPASTPYALSDATEEAQLAVGHDAASAGPPRAASSLVLRL